MPQKETLSEANARFRDLLGNCSDTSNDTSYELFALNIGILICGARR
jgi:hypothetical protein